MDEIKILLRLARERSSKQSDFFADLKKTVTCAIQHFAIYMELIMQDSIWLKKSSLNNWKVFKSSNLLDNLHGALTSDMSSALVIWRGQSIGKCEIDS